MNGAKLKTLRVAAKIKQRDAAAIFGVLPSTVSMWESGKSCPKASMLPVIAQTYGCTIDQLFAQ